MTCIRRTDIRTLKRRRDFLYNRIDFNGESDTGHSYDRAEYEALRRAIEILEPQVVLADVEEASI